MIWNDHKKDVPEGAHAFLGASKYSWLNYTDEKLIDVYKNAQMTKQGTKLHELARRLIENRVKLPRSSKTLNTYVNDAIGYKMTPEVPLKYSKFIFGTADAILYSDRNKELRIHDLKTGKIPASFRQLEIYAALFFLEYGKIPGETKIELRIYQNDEVLVGNPEADDILPVMDKIIRFDKILMKLEDDYGTIT